jgi:hypothetical protein
MLLNVETYHLPRKTLSNNDGGTLEIWGGRALSSNRFWHTEHVLMMVTMLDIFMFTLLKKN